MNTTRREFLVSSMVAGAITTTDIAIAASNRQLPVSPRNRWKSGLGLNGFMSSGQQFQKTYPIWEVLDFAATEGFDGIELVDGWPMGGYPPPKETKRVAALKRLYDQYGLSIYSIQTGGPAAYSADANARWAWLRSFADQVQLCQQLGCQFIGHWPGGGLEGNPDVSTPSSALLPATEKLPRSAPTQGCTCLSRLSRPLRSIRWSTSSASSPKWTTRPARQTTTRAISTSCGAARANRKRCSSKSA